MKFKSGILALLITVLLMLLNGCSTVAYQINDWRFSGIGFSKHDSPDDPLCIVKPQVYSDYYRNQKGRNLVYFDLFCTVKISFDRTIVDSSQVDSITVTSIDFNKSLNFTNRTMSKNSIKEYGYTKDNKPIKYLTDIHDFSCPYNCIPRDIALSADKKELNFIVYVSYKIFGKNGVVTEHADSINVIAKKEIAPNSSTPNMFMNQPMVPPRF